MLHETAVRSGRRAGLICAGTGVTLGAAILLIIGILSSVLKPDWFFPVSAAVILVLTIGYYGGRKAGKKVAAGTNQYLAGQILALSALFIPSIALTFINTLLVMVLYMQPGTYAHAFIDYFLKPMYWITLCGMLPALLLGTLWTSLYRHFQRRALK